MSRSPVSGLWVVMAHLGSLATTFTRTSGPTDTSSPTHESSSWGVRVLDEEVRTEPPVVHGLRHPFLPSQKVQRCLRQHRNRVGVLALARFVGLYQPEVGVTEV